MRQDLADTPHRKVRGWVVPILLASLAVNLLIVGIIVGWLASPDGPRRTEWRTVRGLVGEPFIRALPDDHRRALVREVLRDDNRLRESRESLRARFEAFLSELRKEQFDIDKIQTLLKEQRKVALDRQDMGERFLLERLETMSVGERRDYADALEQALRQPRR